MVKLPVVVTNVGDCNKVVFNKSTGLLIPPGSSNELANGIMKLIGNEQTRILLGSNLNALVTEKYSENHYLDQLIALYLNSNE